MHLVRAYSLAALSGVLYFLAFPGFDAWPLAFVALVPVLHLTSDARLPVRHVIGVGLWFGFVTNWGGYYWLVGMLERFSGFSTPVCVLVASVLCLFQGGQLAAFFVMCVAFARRGLPLVWLAAPIYAASERAYPLLFPSYYANCFHNVPWLLQIVDLGGPTLLSALAVFWNVALLDVLHCVFQRRMPDRRITSAAIASLLCTVGYGAYRVADIDARIASAPKRRIGIVQADMGIFNKRRDPSEGHRRHIEQSLELERDAGIDLLVWPETAIVWAIGEDTQDLSNLLSPLRTPVLLGGISRRQVDGRRRTFNTAFITDDKHRITGSYDKTYLLAFGEYLPFAERFPQLYRVSPHTGRFSAGDHQRPLTWGDIRIAALICYEDVLPDFTRQAVRVGDPHLLVNLTNDSWFGDTHEPWIHLALAKLRAVEHHRSLVRATNSGVSAFVDAAGRVTSHTGVFVRANIHDEVALLSGDTMFRVLGDWPGWFSVLAVLAIGYRLRHQRRDQYQP